MLSTKGKGYLVINAKCWLEKKKEMPIVEKQKEISIKIPHIVDLITFLSFFFLMLLAVDIDTSTPDLAGWMIPCKSMLNIVDVIDSIVQILCKWYKGWWLDMLIFWFI